MGYGSTDQENERAHKTGRIAIMAILVFLLGAFVFAYKVEACKTTPANCKDEFHEIHTDRQNEFTCYAGAVAEVVNSPPAPKPGIICHCPAPGATPTPKPSP